MKIDNNFVIKMIRVLKIQTLKHTYIFQFSLVCDKEMLRPLFQMVYIIGAMLGVICGGALSDRFGRLTTARVFYCISLITMIVLVSLRSFTLILLTRVISGFGLSGLFLVIFTLAMEQVPLELRTTVGMLSGVPYAIFTIVFGGIGYYVRDWRILFIICNSPIILGLPLLLFFLDESPIWLIQKHRYEEAKVIIIKATKLNNNRINDIKSTTGHTIYIPNNNEQKISTEIILRNECLPSKEDENNINKCRSWWQGVKKDANMFLAMKEISLIAPCVWLSQNILYFGLIFSANDFSSGNPFIYLINAGAWEAAAMAGGTPLTRKFGRKPVLIVGYLFSGILMLSLTVAPRDSAFTFWLLIAPAIVGVGCSYQVLYMYTPELFPTLIRGRGFSTCIFSGSIGTFLAPVITDIVAQRVPWVIPIIFGVCGILPAALVNFLPETNRLPLCETVADVVARKKGIFNKTENNSSKLQEIRSECNGHDNIAYG